MILTLRDVGSEDVGLASSRLVTAVAAASDASLNIHLYKRFSFHSLQSLAMIHILIYFRFANVIGILS